MKSVKWNLFILHFWITIFDYSVSFLTVPYLLVPEFAGIPHGVLRLLSVPTEVQVITILTVYFCELSYQLSVIKKIINCKLVDQEFLYNFAIDHFLLSPMITQILIDL